MSDINRALTPDSQSYALKAAVFAKTSPPQSGPEQQTPVQVSEPVYGPPAPPKETYSLAKQGQSQADYAFYEAAEEANHPDAVLDKVREGMGEKAFLGAAGVVLAGALAAGSKVKLKVGIEDQIPLPNARLELSVSLKENRQARELRDRGPAALVNPGQLEGPHKPRGAGVQLGFKTEF